jgi:hypothetical protein
MFIAGYDVISIAIHCAFQYSVVWGSLLMTSISLVRKTGFETNIMFLE